MPGDPFHLTEVDHDELLQILLGHFGNAQGISAGVTRFQTSGSPHYLDVRMTRTGSIARMTRSRSFPRTELQAVEGAIAQVLHDNGTTVGTTVVFASEEVQGWFRYRDRFQIAPVPPGVPTPTNKIVDDQPFLLQVRYRRSGNFQIDLMRLNRQTTFYGRVLNLLLIGRVKLPSRYTQSAWVMDWSNPQNVTSEWKRLGYVLNVPFQQDDFVAVDDYPSLPTLEVSDYFRKSFYHSTFSLHIPQNLSQSLDAVMSLALTDRQRFLTACEWYTTYWQVVAQSSSAAYVALVTAIESLMKNGAPVPCEVCGQPRYRLGKRFQDFIKVYAPFATQRPTELKRLYDVRSGLTHGLELMEDDRAPWAFMKNWRGQYEDDLRRYLTSVVGIAIYNWLWTQAVHSTSVSTTAPRQTTTLSHEADTNT